MSLNDDADYMIPPYLKCRACGSSTQCTDLVHSMNLRMWAAYKLVPGAKTLEPQGEECHYCNVIRLKNYEDMSVEDLEVVILDEGQKEIFMQHVHNYADSIQCSDPDAKFMSLPKRRRLDWS